MISVSLLLVVCAARPNLADAAAAGDLPAVKAAVAAGAKPERREAAAVAAACHGQLSVLRFLIDAGAAPSVFGPAALRCMIAARCQSPIDLANGACTPTAAAELEPALVEVEKWLLDSGLPPNARDPRGESLLQSAASNCTPFVVPLLDHHAEVDAADPQGVTPLLTSLECPGLTELLLARGASARATTREGVTALHSLPDSELEPKLFAERLAALLAKGADVNALQHDGVTPLMRAVGMLRPALRRDRAELRPIYARALLAAGANVRATSAAGETALHFAAAFGCASCVSVLLEKGAAVEATTKDGRTPLSVAAAHRGPEAVRLLLAAGARPQTADDRGLTPLHEAVDAECPECVALLLEKGAVVDALSKKGFTPLAAAAQNGRTDLVKRLLAAGAKPTAATNDGQTPLHLTANWPECARALIEGGALVDAADKDGRTPLHLAAPPVALVLLAAKANPNVKDAQGLTPLHVAAEARSADEVNALLSRGAQVNAVDKLGRTPLHVAASSQPGYSLLRDLVAAFTDAGADLSLKDLKGRTAYHLLIEAGSAREAGDYFLKRPPGPFLGGSAAASSTLTEKGRSVEFYSPPKALDGKLSSCWCKAAGTSLSGAWIQITLAKPQRVKALRIYPGCGESEATYGNNNRIRELQVNAEGVQVNEELPDERRYHDLGFQTKAPVSSVQVLVKDVYPGEKYDDTCVAELQFELEP